MSICGKAGVWLDGLGLVGIELESAGKGVVVDTDLADAGGIFAKGVGSGLSSCLKTSLQVSVAQEHHVHGQVLSYERGYFYALYGFSRLLLGAVFSYMCLWASCIGLCSITMCFSVRTMMCLSVVVCGFGSQQGYSLKKL